MTDDPLQKMQLIDAFSAALSVQDWGHITKQNYENKSYVLVYELYGIHSDIILL